MAYHLISKIPKALLKVVQGFNVKFDPKKHTHWYLIQTLSAPAFKYLVANHGVSWLCEGEDEFTWKLMFQSCERGNLDMFKCVHPYFEDIHWNYDGLLVRAAKYNQVDIVKYLIAHGAQDHGALREASRCFSFEVVEYLQTLHYRCPYALHYTLEKTREKKAIRDEAYVAAYGRPRPPPRRGFLEIVDKFLAWFT
jgi:hypothetical protein